MRRTLLRSPAFGRDLRRWLKSHPDTAAFVEATLEQLSADAAHPSLRTHKLRPRQLPYSISLLQFIPTKSRSRSCRS